MSSSARRDVDMVEGWIWMDQGLCHGATIRKMQDVIYLEFPE